MYDEFGQAILSQLARGKANAITKDKLSKRLNCGERTLREKIKELRGAGYLIGLSVRRPYGYYIIETAEELQECMAILKSYCVEAALARRDMKRGGRMLLEQEYRDKTGQLLLF